MESIINALPIIFSLVIMEVLLSVDNALVLAAMVSHLKGREQTLALRAGMIGAYVLRGVALVFASVLIANTWLRLFGAAYLFYLMSKKLADDHDQEQAGKSELANRSFWYTVLMVELADLSFSIDNVITAVALSPKLWVIIAGTFIGIAAMRFVAGYFAKLMKDYPALELASYLLVGYVGLQLLAHELFHFEVAAVAKLGIILSIVAMTLIYDRSAALKLLFGPFFKQARFLLTLFARAVDLLFMPLKWLLSQVLTLWKQ